MTKKVIPSITSSPPIRRLNLLGCDSWFTGEQCVQLSRSPLGTHCQVLFIKVKQRKSIRSLINIMPNLRALIVRCQEDHFRHLSLPTQDKLVDWLKGNLSPLCSIKRHPRFFHQIRIWIYSSTSHPKRTF
jgi:hypothetical protein